MILHANMAMPDVQRYPTTFVWISTNYISIFFFKMNIFTCGFSANVTFAFLVYEKRWRNSEINSFRVRKRRYLPHFWSDKGFKGIVGNRTMLSLHGGSFNITLTVPSNVGSEQILRTSKNVKIKFVCRNFLCNLQAFICIKYSNNQKPLK